jgi:cell division inhibitor SepF
VAGILNKLKDLIGLNDREEYDYYEEEVERDDLQNEYAEENSQSLAEEEQQHRRRYRDRITAKSEVGMGTNTKSNVIGMPGLNNSIAEVVVFEPRSFEEMPQVIQALRERRSAVLNLNFMDPDDAQRAVDFVAGGTYAIDGHQERIGESIFLFTPSCVQVTTQSGIVHEASAPGKTPARTATTPTPSWSAEASRIAQA